MSVQAPAGLGRWSKYFEVGSMTSYLYFTMYMSCINT